MRGDWQLLPWILHYARDPKRQTGKTPLTRPVEDGDNLRRSLSAPSSFLMMLAAWTLPGTSPELWTALFLGSVGVPAFIPFIDGLIPRRWGISKRSHLRAVGTDVFISALQTSVAVTMLPHLAWIMADAVARTLVRLYVTKRNLLEWVTAAQAEYGADLRLMGFYSHLGEPCS